MSNYGEEFEEDGGSGEGGDREKGKLVKVWKGETGADKYWRNIEEKYLWLFRLDCQPF